MAVRKMKALAVVLLLLAGVWGCRREETPSADPAARAAAVAKAESACKAVGRSMNELTARMKERLKTEDMSKVMSELEKTPEWRQLTEELQRRSEELAVARQRR